MRRRLLIVYVSLLVVTCLGLAIPLAGTLAARSSADMVLDRSNDAVRLASLAGPALASGDTEALRGELDIYHELYGIEAAVVDDDGQIVVASDPRPDVSAEDTSREIQAGLAGNRVGPGETVYPIPWHGSPLTVVEPVVLSGEVIGAVVTVSPVGALQRSTLVQWLGIGLGVVLALGVGIAAAAPLARWVLRPVRELDQASRSIGGGELATRVPVADGPPELRQLSQSFNQMADTITTLLERQRLFVAYASHQVRNPLAALRLRVDSLSGQMRSGAEEAHALALDEVDRLTRICDGLLTLARSGGAAPQAEQVDARAVAEARVAAWVPVAERAGARLRACGSPGSDVWCGAGTLDQALDVLIDNALKFGGWGVSIAVHVGLPRGGRVEVHVVDDGPGLDREQLRTAGTPFWQSGEGVDGAGLGLSLVATLVEMSGGGLRLTPARPRGIDACLDLPAADRTRSAAQRAGEG
ncbi:HAMP domain-containing sensor histidine kinase [Lipingzhangella sp. LS1_29]|uniref:histidine kinase n=1 Tax=Lipingzhangella rawalii TaxID=2055835 RepID=A0ABU2H5J7_9ACTN|nr:HAMP domain-containing sensor histidine kinase [Lipingzhangella rawalii]MDS1270581.1 HAMP domain-containing sensor histidine kinase [Lipingzhangella rawalii]